MADSMTDEQLRKVAQAALFFEQESGGYRKLDAGQQTAFDIGYGRGYLAGARRKREVTDAMVERVANAGLAAQIPGPHNADPCCTNGYDKPVSGTCFLNAWQMRFLARVILQAALAAEEQGE